MSDQERSEAICYERIVERDHARAERDAWRAYAFGGPRPASDVDWPASETIVPDEWDEDTDPHWDEPGPRQTRIETLEEDVKLWSDGYARVYERLREITAENVTLQDTLAKVQAMLGCANVTRLHDIAVVESQRDLALAEIRAKECEQSSLAARLEMATNTIAARDRRIAEIVDAVVDHLPEYERKTDAGGPCDTIETIERAGEELAGLRVDLLAERLAHREARIDRLMRGGASRREAEETLGAYQGASITPLDEVFAILGVADLATALERIRSLTTTESMATALARSMGGSA